MDVWQAKTTKQTIMRRMAAIYPPTSEGKATQPVEFSVVLLWGGVLRALAMGFTLRGASRNLPR